jgi:hypothetical protein
MTKTPRCGAGVSSAWRSPSPGVLHGMRFTHPRQLKCWVSPICCLSRCQARHQLSAAPGRSLLLRVSQEPHLGAPKVTEELIYDQTLDKFRNSSCKCCPSTKILTYHHAVDKLWETIAVTRRQLLFVRDLLLSSDCCCPQNISRLIRYRRNSAS